MIFEKWLQIPLVNNVIFCGLGEIIHTTTSTTYKGETILLMAYIYIYK